MVDYKKVFSAKLFNEVTKPLTLVTTVFRIDDSTLINIHFLRLSYTYLSLYHQLHELYEAKA